MAFLKKKNCARTTLNGSITAGATFMVVADGSQLPATEDFLVTIWNKASFADPCDDPNTEIVKVTNVSGNTLTITRAQESTTAVAHSSGHAVEQLITAGTFEELETAIDGKQPAGSYLQNIVEDTTPELGGELDCGAHSVVFTFNTLGSTNVDWRIGNKAGGTLTGNVTLTFTNPNGSANLTLLFQQGISGGATVTWPANVKWPGGVAPTLSTGLGEIDIVSLFYDGSGTYYGVASTGFV